NMVPPDGAVAAFALTYVGEPVWIVVSLDPTDHYSVIATISYTNEIFTVRSANLTLWGVPADPAHDALRQNPDVDASVAMGTPFTGPPIKPFLTLPSLCGVPDSMQMRADSWQHPGAFTPWQVGPAATMTGCDDPRFRFEPKMTVQAESHSASTPSGLDVDLSV